MPLCILSRFLFISFMFFCFKQKTAYEMRISDWSSDVCSSDLIRSLSVSDYRRHIGLVLQEPFLFFGTIAENIAYGKPQATRQEIIAAARAANAHEFILRLPHGGNDFLDRKRTRLNSSH